jgi:hypothetical protein
MRNFFHSRNLLILLASIGSLPIAPFGLGVNTVRSQVPIEVVPSHIEFVPGQVERFNPTRSKDVTTIKLPGVVINGSDPDLNLSCDRINITVSERIANTTSIVATGVASGQTTKDTCNFDLSYTIPRSLPEPKSISGVILIRAESEEFSGTHSISFDRSYDPNISNPDSINYGAFGGISIKLKSKTLRRVVL